MREISSEELKWMIDRKERFQLIDIREQYESENVSIGGELIPMGEVFKHAHKISKEIPVIIYCKSGHRSKAVVQKLERLFLMSPTCQRSERDVHRQKRSDNHLLNYQKRGRKICF